MRRAPDRLCKRVSRHRHSQNRASAFLSPEHGLPSLILSRSLSFPRRRLPLSSSSTARQLSC